MNSRKNFTDLRKESDRGFDPVLLALLVAGPLAFALYSLWLGLDANWDLKNYHYYNAYALWNGRYGFDVAPGHQPTFYNPLLYLPLYAAFEYLPARAIGLMLGALHGLNLPLVYLLARQVLRQPLGRAPALALAVLGVTGAGVLSEIGTSFADIFLNLFFLGALLLGLRASNRGEGGIGAWAALAAGGLIGLAVGLKLTVAVYAVGLGLGLLGLDAPWRTRFKILIWVAIGGAAGFALTGGYWAWFLWDRYQNPFFPYFNPIFRSPFFAAVEQAGTGFSPRTLWEALIYPVLFTLDSLRVAELQFRDARILIAYGLTFAALGMLLWRKPAFAISQPAANRMLLLTAAGVYLPWLFVFAVYRYAVGLEMLAPIVAVAALDRLGLSGRAQALIGAALALVAVAVQDNTSWGRRPWPETGDYFAVQVPEILEPEKGMVFMAGFHPTSYALPKFPPPLRFVRLQGYFIDPKDTANPQNTLIKEIIAGHRGGFYALFTQGESHTMTDALKAHGFEIQQAGCQAVPTVFDDGLTFCPVVELARITP